MYDVCICVRIINEMKDGCGSVDDMGMIAALGYALNMKHLQWYLFITTYFPNDEIFILSLL